MVIVNDSLELLAKFRNELRLRSILAEQRWHLYTQSEFVRQSNLHQTRTRARAHTSLYLLAQVADDIGVCLGQTRALHQLVHFAHGAVARQRLQVVQQIGLLRFEQRSIRLVEVTIEPSISKKTTSTNAHPRIQQTNLRLVPEAAHIDPQRLRRAHHFAQRPHQRTVHAHQLLRVDAIGLV